jgi:solute carrier family 35 protein E1
MTMVRTAKLGMLMFSWFFLNVMYNITNKKCQNAFPMPWTMTFVSLAVGVPYILTLWASGLRKPPKLNPGWWKTLMPIGAAHALGHAGAVIALGAGAVSFAQTVKAAEPVFTCVLSYFVLGTVFKWPVYASLIPIIGGVSLASLKELSFTWKALYGAVTSNVAFASRAVLSKATMEKPVGEIWVPLTSMVCSRSLPSSCPSHSLSTMRVRASAPRGRHRPPSSARRGSSAR